MGVDYDLFTRAIYSEQNKLDYFITIGKGERKKVLDELLGIDRFEQARSSAGTLVARLRDTKKRPRVFGRERGKNVLEQSASLYNGRRGA